MESSRASASTPRAFGYRRCSTESQVDSGLGLDAQQTAIETAATRLGLTMGQTFTDAGVSGGLALESRPALLAALDALEAGDVLLVAKRDRLGRDLLNVAMIERLVARRGARVQSAAGEGTDDDGPTGRLMRQIIDAFSEYERALIRARVRAAMAAAKARGRRVGHVPFGQQVTHDRRHLQPHADEQQLLAVMHAQRAAGVTVRELARRLNEQGYRTRRGNRWYHQAVCQLLRRHPETTETTMTTMVQV